MSDGFGHEPSPGTQATDSWLTPPEFIQALGPFDMGVCCPPDMPWRTAPVMLTEKEDGLKTPWRGVVWCNPPYGRSTGTWLDKLADHDNGIALTFARTETQAFFKAVWPRCSALLFVKSRISFYRPDGTRAGNGGAPSVLIGYGSRAVNALAAQHGKLGHCLLNMQDFAQSYGVGDLV